VGFTLITTSAHADRPYFVQSYLPYLDPAGEAELEFHSCANSGRGDSSATDWSHRIEFEYGLADRLTASAYLNYVQGPGTDAPLMLDGPSLELIYQLAKPGHWPVDPAAYLETRVHGSEIELEPKLLLARRNEKLIGVANLIGEFEHHGSGADQGTTEKNLMITAGASRKLGRGWALGIEAVYTHAFLDHAPDASYVLLGPTLELEISRLQLTLGWHPQVSGSPASSGGLNLANFPRSQARLIVGVEL
jgi:hypothetical protein